MKKLKGAYLRKKILYYGEREKRGEEWIYCILAAGLLLSGNQSKPGKTDRQHAIYMPPYNKTIKQCKVDKVKQKKGRCQKQSDLK